MQKWDKGLDYKEMYNKLLHLAFFSNRQTQRAYSLILLLQLRNGARISEAVRGFKEWLNNTNKEEVEVRVSKKKKEEFRKMVIPIEFKKLKGEEFAWIKDVNELKLIRRIKTFANYNKINTHSLRYSYITYLLKQNINPSLIAKIT
ncbi:MAG: tyrosine-type recombinase/integrase, partial [Candidatus Micrarchaeia archaeon]